MGSDARGSGRREKGLSGGDVEGPNKVSQRAQGVMPFSEPKPGNKTYTGIRNFLGRQGLVDLGSQGNGKVAQQIATPDVPENQRRKRNLGA